MKHLFAILLGLFLFNFCSAQNNSLSLKNKMEENDQFIALVKKALIHKAQSRSFNQLKSYTFDRHQYEMEWDTATSSWDTTAKFTYYSNQAAAGIVEYKGYVDFYTQNSITIRDSVYMKVDSNLNVFKLPFNLFEDYVSILSRFIIDTTTNQYRKYSERLITSNSMGDITGSSYDFYNWNPGQSSSVSNFASYDFYYTANGSIDYCISRTRNFFGSGYSQDSLTISANSSHYPLVVTEYEKHSSAYEPKKKYIHTYNANHDVIRRIYQDYDSWLGNFSTYSEHRVTFVNGLLQSDSLFNGAGLLRSVSDYYYNSNSLLDSMVSVSHLSNPPTIEYWNRYEYDSQNRLILRTYLYPVFGNYLQGSRTWYVYSQLSASLQEGDQSQNEISIFPNPANDKIIIEGEFTGDRLQIRNTSGKLVREFHNLRPSDVIQIVDLSSGFYFLCFDGGEVKKLIKQ